MRRPEHASRKPGPLNLDIYSALLGGRPRIQPRDASESPRAERLRLRVRVEASIERGTRASFFEADFHEQLGRCAAQAARVLAGVKGRVLGAFQESTIGKRDRRSRPRVEVTITDAARRYGKTPRPERHAA